RGKGSASKKGFASEPQEHGRVLPHRPQHAQMIEVFVGLAQNVDALVFQLAKVIHRIMPLVPSECTTGLGRFLDQFIELSRRGTFFEHPSSGRNASRY